MRFARAVLGVLLLLAAAWSMAPASKAQGGNSVNVGGTVTDQTGAVVPGATVTIHDQVSGFEESATTDASG
ncbi:MAG: carboxypeptidase-like regulatory domain-containing protein, partial [Candidatus Acidiferrales bacterium]